MVFAFVFTMTISAALLGSAIYLLLWGDKPEPPTWESFINNGKKHWRKK